MTAPPRDTELPTPGSLHFPSAEAVASWMGPASPPARALTAGGVTRSVADWTASPPDTFAALQALVAQALPGDWPLVSTLWTACAEAWLVALHTVPGLGDAQRRVAAERGAQVPEEFTAFLRMGKQRLSPASQVALLEWCRRDPHPVQRFLGSIWCRTFPWGLPTGRADDVSSTRAAGDSATGPTTDPAGDEALVAARRALADQPAAVVRGWLVHLAAFDLLEVLEVTRVVPWTQTDPAVARAIADALATATPVVKQAAFAIWGRETPAVPVTAPPPHHARSSR